MFLNIAPLKELSTTIKTVMKVVDNTLFRSPQELKHVMGIFLESDKMEKVHMIDWNASDGGQLDVTIIQPRHVN